jgi:hypothetical protein
VRDSNTAEADSPTSVTVATPPDWDVLDLAQFDDLSAIRARVAESVAEYADGEDYASRISQLLGVADENGVFFAATAWPREDGSRDVTTLTLAAPTMGSQERVVAIETSQRSEEDIPANAIPITTETGPSQNAADLPAGPAARTESDHILELGSPLPPLPVFCVEYALMVPGTERVIVMTFTTIAPSDTDMLREQFADIASTLAFV